MNKLVFATLATFLAIGLMPSGTAESYTATYVGASPGIAGVTSTAPGLVVPGSQFGGANFPADGSTPLRVIVEDASGGDVYVVVCQNPTGGLCGEAGEPRAVGCGEVDLSTSAVAFSPDLPTVVFIYWTNTGIVAAPTCVGTTTTGTITLVTAFSDQDG